jgi:hypothetical protein
MGSRTGELARTLLTQLSTASMAASSLPVSSQTSLPQSTPAMVVGNCSISARPAEISCASAAASTPSMFSSCRTGMPRCAAAATASAELS